MAIEKYTTKSIVIDSYANGENDRVYKLFTREFGLIMAHAKSIRKLESKLRAHVLPRSLALVTLVQGKEVWRLVGAEEQKLEDKIIHEVTSLIARFIRGEGEHKVLYDRIIDLISEAKKYDIQKLRLLLYYIILTELGYADVKVLGAKNMKEYLSWSVNDLYTHLLLVEKNVRSHVHAVLSEAQL